VATGYHTEIVAFREKILEANDDIEPISQVVISLYPNACILKKSNRLIS
jgi:hypothetical protein